MDTNRFERSVLAIRASATRRMIAMLIAGSVAGGLLRAASLPVDAKKHKKKITLCHAGQTIKVSKKGKKKHLAHGDTPGACLPPPPPGPNPSCQGPFDTGVAAIRRVAVTFTAERTGKLAAAECRLGSTNGGEDFTLEIRTVDAAGVPTTTVLASDSVTNVANVSSNTPLTAIFDPPPEVLTGVRYAFVVTAGPNQGVFALGRSGNPCPDHNLFTDTAATNTYQPVASQDMLFYASIITWCNNAC